MRRTLEFGDRLGDQTALSPRVSLYTEGFAVEALGEQAVAHNKMPANLVIATSGQSSIRHL